MTVKESLLVVVNSVIRITGSRGTPQDQPKVTSFVQNAGAVPLDVYFYVGGIPLGNFFAFSGQGFDDSKLSLWQEIQTGSGQEGLPAPSDWGIATHLLQLAVYIHGG